MRSIDRLIEDSAAGAVRIFGPGDAGAVRAQGIEARKRTHVFVVPRPDVLQVTVRTDEGDMQCPVGGYIVCDSEATQVWPISKEYFETNYEPV